MTRGSKIRASQPANPPPPQCHMSAQLFAFGQEEDNMQMRLYSYWHDTLVPCSFNSRRRISIQYRLNAYFSANLGQNEVNKCNTYKFEENKN